MSVSLVLTELIVKSLHVGSVHFSSQSGLMHMPAIVLFCVERASIPDLLPRGSHSEWPFVFHACCAGSSKQSDNLHNVMLIPKAGALAAYL